MSAAHSCDNMNVLVCRGEGPGRPPTEVLLRTTVGRYRFSTEMSLSHFTCHSDVICDTKVRQPRRRIS